MPNKDDKKARQATTVGAVLGIVGLLIALGTVTAVNVHFTTDPVIVGGLVTGFDTLFSVEDTDDWHTVQPLFALSGCAPIVRQAMNGDFTAPAARGAGLGYVFTTPILAPCPLKANAMLFRTNATVGSVMALNPKFFSVGLANDLPGNQSFMLTLGLVNPGLGVNWGPSALPAQSFLTLDETSELIIPIDAAFVGFAALLPTWEIGVNIFGLNTTDLGPAGTTWNMDFNAYGNQTNTSVALTLFDAVRPDIVLIGMFIIVGALSWLAAVWIWPRKTMDGFFQSFERNRR